MHWKVEIQLGSETRTAVGLGRVQHSEYMSRQPREEAELKAAIAALQKATTELLEQLTAQAEKGVG